MSEQHNADEFTKSNSTIKSGEGSGPAGPQTPESDTSILRKEGLPQELSADEQMALYEKDLKENDWGHQPC